MADCTHGMPTPAACFECMEDGNLAPPPKPEGPYREPGASTTARHDGGICDGCGGAVHVGQEIQKWTDGRWRHRGCTP